MSASGKFRWHHVNRHTDCADIDKALAEITAFEKPVVSGIGWFHRMSLAYLIALCGLDPIQLDDHQVKVIEGPAHPSGSRVSRPCPAQARIQPRLPIGSLRGKATPIK